MGMFNSLKRANSPTEVGTIGVGEDDADAPWARAQMHHENSNFRLNAQVANWRKFAFISLGIAAIAVVGNLYQSSQSKFVPMVLEVDKLGQVVAVKALYGDEAVIDAQRVIYNQMFELIEDLRTVSTDRQANDDRLERGFKHLSGAARTYVRDELRKAPPNQVGATKTVQVVVRTALKLTGKTWQIDWEEKSFSLSGEQIGVELWRATLQYELSPSPDEKVFRRNPIGFISNELSWQKVIRS